MANCPKCGGVMLTERPHDHRTQAVPPGALRITLDGEKISLNEFARLLRATDRLLRALTKEVAPGVEIEWTITEMSILSDGALAAHEGKPCE